MTTGLMTKSDTISAAFERLDSDSPVHTIRRAAFERFQLLGWPTNRDEEWRYTSIKPITETAYACAPGAAERAAPVTTDQLRDHLLSETDCYRMVFVNGRFSSELSILGELEGKPAGDGGVRLRDLRSVISESHADVETHLGQYAGYDEDTFTALNTAFIEDGVFLALAPGTKLRKPVHVLFVTAPSDEPVTVHPRMLIVAEAGSEATVVETHVGLGDGVSFTNAVTEIVAAENTTIDHYRVQRENDRSFHVSTLRVHQAGSNNVTSHCFTGGGRIVRNNLHAVLDGEECHATFNGLYLNGGKRQVDNHLHIDHLKPNCRSWQFYKGILEDKSTGVFSGRIFVAEDAQKTDAKQTSMSLLLSDDAHAYTKPQLEIFADDVKCTHGATIGQLEESQMFYLQARGIKREAARSLLVFAFANETIGEILIPELRRKLEHELFDRLPLGNILKGSL